MTVSIQVHLHPAQDVTVLAIEGNLTSAADTAVAAAYQEAIQQSQKLVLAFREEDIINSAGIGLIIDLVSQSQQQNVALSIAHPAAHFRKVFAMVGLTRHIPVSASVEDAQQAF
ncbi:MAG: STAS domain-containing protein [Candidatus Latescibacteria bacterium]|nr:STAS domain-containing protein [Candidatus Latescibacterota bacterium]